MGRAGREGHSPGASGPEPKGKARLDPTPDPTPRPHRMSSQTEPQALVQEAAGSQAPQSPRSPGAEAHLLLGLGLHPPPPQEQKGCQYHPGCQDEPLSLQISHESPSLSHPLTTKQLPGSGAPSTPQTLPVQTCVCNAGGVHPYSFTPHKESPTSTNPSLPALRSNALTTKISHQPTSPEIGDRENQPGMLGEGRLGQPAVSENPNDCAHQARWAPRTDGTVLRGQ